MTAPIQPTAALPSAGAGISEEKRAVRVSRVSLISSLFMLALAAISLVIAFIQSNTQMIVPAAVLICTFLLQILMAQGLFIKDSSTKVFVLSLSMDAALILLAVFFSSTALITSGIILMFALLCSITLLEGEKADAIVPITLMAAIFAGLLGTYPPITQTHQPVLVYTLAAIFASLFLAFCGLLMTGVINATLRIKITLAALFIVIIPLGLISIINASFLNNTLLAQTESNLTNSASLLRNRVDEFILTNRVSMAAVTNSPVFTNYLKVQLGQRPNSYQEEILQSAIESYRSGIRAQEAAFLESLKLIDINGFVAYSTKSSEVGANEKYRSYFKRPIEDWKVYSSAVEFSPYDGRPYLYFSAVVTDPSNGVIGVFVACYNAVILQSMANSYVTKSDRDSYPIILDENFMRIAEAGKESLLYSTLAPISNDAGYNLSAASRLPNKPISSLSTGHADFASKLSTVDIAPFFQTDTGSGHQADYVAVIKTANMPWYIAYIESKTHVQNLLDDQNRLAVIIATLIAGALSMLATYVAQVFSNPITHLTDTAQQVSMGNLEARASVQSKDELGILATAFNNMTLQLQMFISSLENRVQERTRELAQRNDDLTFRARQLETIADVARGVTQTQSLEDLLTQVTRLISERFNFYHVGVFLVDESGKYAVLRAANSEGGQHMLKRQHRLEIGQTGIVGYATATGEARIATDVGQDAVFFNNPDLPQTRSEMALPLMVGDRIIGALDVQSVESGAFTQEDSQLFKILADQVAMAIYNNQLYMETRQALHEAQLVHQRYLQQEWSHESAQNRHTAYRYTPAGTTALSPDDEDVLTAAPDEARVDEEGGQTVLAVPVKLRGETIGIIRVQEASGGAGLAEEEVLTVEAVADQVALALENARLFNQTTRKAERERRVLEITSRIRSTNDPTAMMQIAVEELQRTLSASRAQVVLQPSVPGGNGRSGAGGHNSHNGHHGRDEEVDPDQLQ